MSRTTKRLTARHRAMLRTEAEAARGKSTYAPVSAGELASLLDDADVLDGPAGLFTPSAAVAVEHWEADEYVLTVGGFGPVGGTMHKAEAEGIARWLREAVAEMATRRR